MAEQKAVTVKKAEVPFKKAIQAAKAKFAGMAVGRLQYDIEAVFATQQLMRTDYAMQIANKNPASVHLAMLNLASTGLTLNPANSYAYLVPRDGAIVLDISYKGLIKIATDCGSVLWAKADVVYEHDKFIYHGPTKLPEHTGDIFGDRGEPIGAYCVAKTVDGSILTEVLTSADLAAIRAHSDLYKKKGTGPWIEFWTEMAKKAAIKRASKTWPYSQRQELLLNAIEIANRAEGGYSFDDEGAQELINEHQKSEIIDWLSALEANEAEFLAYLGVEAVDAIPASRFNEVINTLKARHEAQS